MKRWFVRVVWFVGLGVSSAAGGSPPRTVRPEQKIVVLKRGADPAAVAKRHQIAADRVYGHALRGFAGRVPAARLQRLVADLDVVAVEQDVVVHHCAQTLPTGVRRIGADANAVARINGVDERVDADVAVIDTGIDSTHPDLNVAVSKGFLTGVTTGRDDHGHGTHVAGIIAALDNGAGVVGVAPGARLWALKVLDKTGSGYLSDVIEALDYVTANADRIAVVNMSLGTTGRIASFRMAVQSCVARGVVVVAAAGNESRDVLGPDGVFDTGDDSIPAAYPEVAAVSALCDTDGRAGGLGPRSSQGTADDTLAPWSNLSRVVPGGRPVTSPGGAIDAAAPGVDIRSTYPGGRYATLSGTSMASPHVAGAAALYIAAHGRARDAAGVYAIRQALIASAQPQGRWGPANTADPDPNREGLVYVGPTSPPPPNTAPTVVLTRPADASTFTSTDTIAFQGTATDPEDGALTASLRWTSSLDGPLGTGGSFSRTLSVGTHTITAFVTDSGGLSGQAAVAITVTPPNTPPVVTITAPRNADAFLLSVPTSFQGTATDKEDGDLSANLQWTSSLDGPIGTGGSFVRVLSLGTHTIAALVTDSGGLTGKASVTVTVESGSEEPPLVVTVSSDRRSYRRQDIAFVVVRVTDGLDPVAGAAVTLRLQTPRGTWLSARGTTDATGVFRAYHYVAARRDGTGLYRLTATASKPGYADGTGSGSFLVP